MLHIVFRITFPIATDGQFEWMGCATTYIPKHDCCMLHQFCVPHMQIHNNIHTLYLWRVWGGLVTTANLTRTIKYGSHPGHYYSALVVCQNCQLSLLLTGNGLTSWSVYMLLYILHVDCWLCVDLCFQWNYWEWRSGRCLWYWQKDRREGSHLQHGWA